MYVKCKPGNFLWLFLHKNQTLLGENLLQCLWLLNDYFFPDCLIMLFWILLNCTEIHTLPRIFHYMSVFGRKWRFL